MSRQRATQDGEQTLSEPEVIVQPVVLAGGRSRRFGSNKALHPWRGRALIDHVLDVVRLTMTPREIWAGVGHLARHPRLVAHLRSDPHMVFLEDDPHMDGPAAGLSAAFEQAALRRLPWVFVCGCDMPTMRIQLLGAMLDLARNAPASVSAIVPRTPSTRGRRFEPLHAFYRPERALPHLRAMASAPQHRLQDFIAALPDAHILDPHALDSLDAQWRLGLHNINTREALHEV